MRQAHLFCLFALAVAGSGGAFAAGNVTPRSELINDYLDEAQTSQDLYQSAPVSQIVPAFNTITYAIAGGKRDISIVPSTGEKEYDFRGVDSQLKLGGYDFSPYLAVSLKHIGLGFSAESGERTAAYTQTPVLGVAYPISKSPTVQESKLTFRSIGAFLYLIPYPDLHKNVTFTVIAGGRNYNCIHDVSQDVSALNTSDIKDSDKKTFTYNVTRYEGGININIQLLKSFAIIPWSDYMVTDASAARDLVNSGSNDTSQAPGPGSTYANLNDDIDLFWFDRPRLRYGIDFAVRIGRFEVHFGDVLGSVAAFNKKADQITDNTLSLSISLDQKAP